LKRSFYQSKFESLVRYGIILGGVENDSVSIFKLQKRVIRTMCGVGKSTSCRQLFKDCKILSHRYVYLKCYVSLKSINRQYKKMSKYMITIQEQI